ncbi:MAG: GGDEF domain-containing protein [Chromatiaceae bacterium]|nr:GGDEF domain-containing protein [Chromatiaceae bacterium]
MSQSAGEWKNKYFDSLAEIEHKERRWQSVESSLRRCISRLSFLGDGIDDQLDRRLEQLRNRVRGEQDIKRLLDEVEEITRRAERAGESKPQSSSLSEEELVLQLVAEADFPKRLEKRAHSLIKALKSPPIKSETVQSAKALLLEAIAMPEVEQKLASSGLLGGLFARDKASLDKPVDGPGVGEDKHTGQIEGQGLLRFLVNQISPAIPATSGLDGFTTRIDAARNNRELEELAAELVELLSGEKAGPRPDLLPPVDEVLLQLVARLDLSPELQPRVQRLKAQLSKGIVQADILPILTELLQLVEHAKVQAEQQRQEVERFLLQLTEQLKTLDQEVNGIGNSGQELIEGGRTIDREMQQQFTHLQEAVECSNDLDELKNSITIRLNRMQLRLRGHRNVTEHLVQDFERRIDTLTTRLGDMEREKGRLHDAMVKARTEAFTDALTGLHNRHAFDCRLQEEFARWSRYNNPLSIIVVDVDHFKKVNDAYGHLAGDKVLHVIGAHLKNSTRQIDFTARYGGEEFVVLLPEADLSGAKTVAEKIRLAVEQKPFHSGSNRVRITVSCGVASFQEGDGRKTPFERADEALYLAKRSGRNRCCTEEQVRLESKLQ